MWPGEGAVAQDIVKMVADDGFRWMASGEQVLARSIGRAGFTRSGSDVVNEADDLYRPYYVQHADGPKVAMFFRDLRLSDLVGFEYSGTPARRRPTTSWRGSRRYARASPRRARPGRTW